MPTRGELILARCSRRSPRRGCRTSRADIVEAGTAGPAKDALLASRLPPGMALADADAAQISEAMLDDLYRQLLTLRLFTSYLPPIWGWAVLVWMRKKEYL